MKNIVAKAKDFWATKSKKAKLLCTTAMIFAMSAVPAFAETQAELADSSSGLGDISTAMNTAVTGAVGTMLAMMIGLIPVALQVLSAFLLFKFGKKFFAKVA